MKLKCRKDVDYLVRRCNRRIIDAKVAGTEKARKKCAAWIARQSPVAAETPDGRQVSFSPWLDGWTLRLATAQRT